jgi:hypothetical protein
MANVVIMVYSVGGADTTIFCKSFELFFYLPIFFIFEDILEKKRLESSKLIDWIYLHLINTNWFLLFGLSLPSLFGLFIIYKLIMITKEQGDSNAQNEKGTQSNQDSQRNQENAELPTKK